MKNKLLPRALRTIAVAAAMLGSTQLPALAAPQWCIGTLSNLVIMDDGGVYVLPNWSSGDLPVCNVNQATGAISATTCMNWVTLMRNAQQRGAQTALYYRDAPVCTSIAGSGVVPGYIRVIN